MATETQTTPRTSTFSIGGPYLSEGRVNIDLARTDLLTLSLKINAEGGENAVHMHLNEDHSFVVLEGEVTFFDEHGVGTTLGQYEGIMIPKGAFYRYLNTGDRNLFLLRVGAKRGNGRVVRVEAQAGRDADCRRRDREPSRRRRGHPRHALRPPVAPDQPAAPANGYMKEATHGDRGRPRSGQLP